MYIDIFKIWPKGGYVPLISLKGLNSKCTGNQEQIAPHVKSNRLIINWNNFAEKNRKKTRLCQICI